MEVLGDLLLLSNMSQCSFGLVIMPGNSIVFEKGKEAVSIADKAFLVFEDEFGSVQFISNRPHVKCIDLLHEGMQVLFFQAILLYRFHNRDNQVFDFRYKDFILAIERIGPQIVVQITNEVHPAFLLFACQAIVPRVEIGDKDPIIVLQNFMDNGRFSGWA